MWESPVEEFEGLSMSALGTDEAYLRIKSEGSGYLYYLNSDCDRCPWQLLGSVSESPFIVKTHHVNSFMLRQKNDTRYVTFSDAAIDPQTICYNNGTEMGEFGVYDLEEECIMTTALKPVNENLILLVMFLVIVACWSIWWALNKWAGRHVKKVSGWLGWQKEEGSGNKSGKTRLRSLDTFRGIAIMIMIFVNDGGGGYWFMEHATWNGLYVADLVFPWFIWIMGVCIPMSVRSTIKRETPLKTVIWQVSVRSVKLFLLGFILNTLGGWINLARLRVPGVLQRFGICYFVVFLVGYAFTPAQPKSYNNTFMSNIQELLHLLPQWIIMIVLLIIHQLITYLVTVPGCEQGYQGPGGIHDWSPERNNSGCIGGITGYIDKKFFTSDHIYGNPTAKGVYSASAFDPEGLFGTLTSIFQVWLGYQAGYILQVYSGHVGRVSRWIGWSLLTGVLAAILCLGTQNDGWVPVNKNLWSISFVMVTSCFAFILLSLLYIIIDIKKWWKGQPFFYAGMNSILLYCGHSVGYNLFPFHFMIGEMRTHSAKLPESLWCAGLWLIIAYVLYRKKIFVTV